MIYVTELFSGFYVEATTSSPAIEIETVQLMERHHWDTRAEAEAAAQIARQQAEACRWTISAIDSATGERFDCFTWTRLPSEGIRRAMADAKIFNRDCHGFRATAA